jgi:hopanoid C-2 methylase
MLKSGNPGCVYFVDDNFIANRHAAEELLPHLIAWQKKNGYPVQFACESTMNMAQYPELLAMMREAYFCTVFCGIETPEPDALKFMRKPQNLAMPLLEAIKALNDHGMEVVSGIIIGLDTDTLDTADKIIEFIKVSQIPLLTINILQALPKTPLWRRLEEAGRILPESEERESNVSFLLPYEDVLAMWRRCVATAYDPENLYARFQYQIEHTYPHRITPPNSAARVNLSNIAKGMAILGNIVARVGVFSRYPRTFWRMALPAMKKGDIEAVIHVGLVAHHLIEFTRECLKGRESASFYSQKRRDEQHAPDRPAARTHAVDRMDAHRHKSPASADLRQ